MTAAARTAISRSNLSRPMAALDRAVYLDGATVLDYGSGRGDDVAILQSRGIDARGWDPNWTSDRKRKSDAVNLGFVINVIKSPRERAAALRGAWALTRKVLAVGVRNSAIKGKRSGDGIETSAGTFQKRYSSAELARYVRKITGAEPVAAGSGIVLVYRDGFGPSSANPPASLGSKKGRAALTRLRSELKKAGRTKYKISRAVNRFVGELARPLLADGHPVSDAVMVLQDATNRGVKPEETRRKLGEGLDRLDELAQATTKKAKTKQPAKAKKARRAKERKRAKGRLAQALAEGPSRRARPSSTCAVDYDDFRGSLNFDEAQAAAAIRHDRNILERNDYSQPPRRAAILGMMRQNKLEEWDEHQRLCDELEDERPELDLDELETYARDLAEYERSRTNPSQIGLFAPRAPTRPSKTTTKGDEIPGARVTFDGLGDSGGGPFREINWNAREWYASAAWWEDGGAWYWDVESWKGGPVTGGYRGGPTMTAATWRKITHLDGMGGANRTEAGARASVVGIVRQLRQRYLGKPAPELDRFDAIRKAGSKTDHPWEENPPKLPAKVGAFRWDPPADRGFGAPARWTRTRPGWSVALWSWSGPRSPTTPEIAARPDPPGPRVQLVIRQGVTKRSEGRAVMDRQFTGRDHEGRAIETAIAQMREINAGTFAQENPRRSASKRNGTSAKRPGRRRPTTKARPSRSASSANPPKLATKGGRKAIAGRVYPVPGRPRLAVYREQTAKGTGPAWIIGHRPSGLRFGAEYKTKAAAVASAGGIPAKHPANASWATWAKLSPADKRQISALARKLRKVT